MAIKYKWTSDSAWHEIPEEEEPEMPKYPMLIESASDYTPQVGDRIEVTWPDVTTIVGTATVVTNHSAFTSRNYLIYNIDWFFYPDNKPDSVRLLSRKPKPLAVGDTITGEQALTLPPGSILTAYESAFDIVTLSSTGGELMIRKRLSRVDRNNTWSHWYKKNLRIKYINN